MKEWLRRVRGALGMGLTWAIAWLPAGALWGLFDWISVAANPNALWFVTVAYTALFGVMGFFGGTIFATLLGSLERSRSLHELSAARLAAWGGLGGLLMSGAMIVTGGAGAITGAIGVATVALLSAGSAATTLAVARRADSAGHLTSSPSESDRRLEEPISARP